MTTLWRKMLVAVVVISGSLSWWVVMADPPTTQERPKLSEREVKKKNPIPADAGSQATGAKIFAGNCAPCHGTDGKGNGKAAALLDKQPPDLTNAKYARETDGTLYWMISNGHRPMPEFHNTLPDESRWNVVNFLRTIIVKPATEPSTGPTTKQ